MVLAWFILLKHLVNLHDVGIGLVRLEFVASPIKAKHKTTNAIVRLAKVLVEIRHRRRHVREVSEYFLTEMNLGSLDAQSAVHERGNLAIFTNCCVTYVLSHIAVRQIPF